MNPYRLIIDVLRGKHEDSMREKLKSHDFSIISQNCTGGVMYHMLGMPMLSPTVNMFIVGENFVKLAKDPKRYLNIDPHPIMDRCMNEADKPHPVIGIDDIRLNCLHYENCRDAITDWNRRKQRVNFDKILVMATSWDLNNDLNLINEILKLHTPHIVFSYDEIDDECVIKLDHKIWARDESGKISPTLTGYYKHGIYRNFEKIFDVVDWINTSLETPKKAGLIDDRCG